MSFKHVTDEILSGYLSGELTAREKYDADSHFTICPECAAKLEEQRAFEKKIAAAYNSSFPLYLSPDAHSAVAEEVSAGFVVNSKAPLWQKRILVKFFTQAASVVFVAALIAVMILTQSRSSVPGENIPAAAPEVPVNNMPAPVVSVKTAPPASSPAPKPDRVVAARVTMPAAEKKVSVAPKQKQPLVSADAPKSAKPKSAPAVAAAPVKPAPVKPAPVKTTPVVVAASVKNAPAAAVAPVKTEPAVKPAAKTVAPVPAVAAVVKKVKVADPLLQSHDSLVKLFRIDPVTIRKKSDNIFLLQGVKSPFAEDLYVIYAAAGMPEKGSVRTVELTLSATGKKLLYAVTHPAAQKDVCVMSFRSRILPREIGKLDFVVSEGQEKQVNSLFFGKDKIASDFNSAPEQIRLAAIIQAASIPQLILKRNVRTKILAELEKLLSGGYAGDPQVKAMYERLKKVR